MTEVSKKLDREGWLRRLDQTFAIDQAAAGALSTLLNLRVAYLSATLVPGQPYDRRLLTFRGDFEVRLARECVVSLEMFEEQMAGEFERSYRLSPTAPSVPEGAEEAEEFPFQGVSLIDMLGDEIALNISAFPRKPGAILPDFTLEIEDTSKKARPFAALESLKKTHEGK